MQCTEKNELAAGVIDIVGEECSVDEQNNADVAPFGEGLYLVSEIG